MTTIEVRNSVIKSVFNKSYISLQETENDQVLGMVAEEAEEAFSDAVDKTIEAFDLNSRVESPFEFWEDGISGLDDEELQEKVDVYFFEAYRSAFKSRLEARR